LIKVQTKDRQNQLPKRYGSSISANSGIIARQFSINITEHHAVH
jgi:hypothetical protein